MEILSIKAGAFYGLSCYGLADACSPLHIVWSNGVSCCVVFEDEEEPQSHKGSLFCSVGRGPDIETHKKNIYASWMYSIAFCRR